MANDKLKKIGGIIIKVFTWLVVAVTVFMMVFTIFSVATFDKNDRSLFGFRFYIVKSDSMSPSENNKDMEVHFSAGDLIIVKEVENNLTLKADDIISFISKNPDTQGEVITHMIREVKTTEDGTVLGYVTFGTNTGKNDEALVEPENVIAKYSGQVPKVGYFLSFLKSVPGYIVCILVPFLILIGYNGMNCILLFRRYKKEQLEEMEAEKAKIEAEREQALEMMKELQALKEQIASGNVNSNVNNDVPAEQKVDTVNTEPTEAADATESAAEQTEECEHSANAATAEQAEAPEQIVDAAVEEKAENAPECEAERSTEDEALEAERKKNLEMAKELEKLKAQVALEEEKRKNEQMMKELEALKAQLAQKNDSENQ